MDEHGNDHPLDDRIELVVLRSENSQLIPVAGCTPVDLTAGTPPGPDLLSELMDSTVQITASEGSSSFVRDRLRTIPVPALFAASPWLADSRPVVVRDGTGSAAGLSVRYSTDVGLRVTESEAGHDVDHDQDG